MELTMYQKEYALEGSIDNFLDFFYSFQMNSLASDLLYQGLSPKQISDAIIKAINVGKSSGMNIREHFKPVFSSMNGAIVNDCKLSRLGYGLVLMNAEIKLSAVCKWQIKVLKEYLAKS
ncbi:hypothetical protein [Maribacter sp. ACAM166]|uniref:hypothetical protein n=1 Tax=Maribacter sp. ACAM166 TaxID=2508996 RepID=UPI0010FF1391|nr:hypothetical protein [Maribacter sp. ACAM166]TLP74262.1 hypothetical protein ES765_16340 [Maribacter sp. ACAM166]